MCAILAPIVLAALFLSIAIHIVFKRPSYEDSKAGLKPLLIKRAIPLAVIATVFIVVFFFFCCPKVTISL